MDPVSHAALGAACAQVLLHKYDKRNAWLIGALGGMAPDLDILIRSASNPMLFLLYHRHFTHALSFIPFGGLLVALGLLPFKRFRKNWWLTLLAAMIGYATHGLLDACTSYGTTLLWPFSNRRIAWDMIAIVDPFITFPLVLGLTWTLVFDNRKGVLLGLLMAGLVLLFNNWQHHRALVAIDNYGKQQGWNLSKIRAFPDMVSVARWRVITYFDMNKQLFLADVFTPLFKPSAVYPISYFPAFHRDILPTGLQHQGRQGSDFNIFNWFTDGYMIAAKQQPLLIVDARYLIGYRPIIALWGIQFTPGKLHVDAVSSIILKGSE